MAGNICHVEIDSTDPDQSKEFLSALFGWTFQDLGPDYSLYDAGDGPGGGLSRVDEATGDGAIRVYIEVDSIDDILERAIGSVGEAVNAKTAIGEGYGYHGSLRDPGGTVIGLWERE